MTNLNNSIEQEMFSWKEWDEIDTGCLIFFHCTMKVDIGEPSGIKAGDVLDSIVISFDRGTIEFNPVDDGPRFEYKLHYRVGKFMQEVKDK